MGLNLWLCEHMSSAWKPHAPGAWGFQARDMCSAPSFHDLQVMEWRDWKDVYVAAMLV